MAERILLCKPKMSGRELDFIKSALSEDWAVPMGPDVTVLEKDIENFINEIEPSKSNQSTNQPINQSTNQL